MSRSSVRVGSSAPFFLRKIELLGIVPRFDLSDKARLGSRFSYAVFDLVETRSEEFFFLVYKIDSTSVQRSFALVSSLWPQETAQAM